MLGILLAMKSRSFDQLILVHLLEFIYLYHFSNDILKFFYRTCNTSNYKQRADIFNCIVQHKINTNSKNHINLWR